MLRSTWTKNSSSIEVPVCSKKFPSIVLRRLKKSRFLVEYLIDLHFCIDSRHQYRKHTCIVFHPSHGPRISAETSTKEHLSILKIVSTQLVTVLKVKISCNALYRKEIVSLTNKLPCLPCSSWTRSPRSTHFDSCYFFTKAHVNFCIS